MSLNRHNPFVAALASLVEPAPAMPAGPQCPATDAAVICKAARPSFLERLESWVASCQTADAAMEAPACELPDQATIEARARRLIQYY